MLLRIFPSLALLFLAACHSPAPEPMNPRTIRVMTWNIHHGRGIDGKVDLKRIAQVIRESEADVVALQEVDLGTKRTQQRDLAGELAQLCGMTRVFGKNIDYQGGDYGNAILARGTIRSSDNFHYNMLREGEQRGLLRATLRFDGDLDTDFDGVELKLWNTHIDYRPDDSERLSNLAEIHDLLDQEAPGPVVLCGDFNDTPGSATHSAALRDFHDSFAEIGIGPGLTFRSDAPKKRIDYVFLRRDAGGESAVRLQPMRSWIPVTQASDHSPLVVEFRVEKR